MSALSLKRNQRGFCFIENEQQWVKPEHLDLHYHIVTHTGWLIFGLVATIDYARGLRLGIFLAFPFAG